MTARDGLSAPDPGPDPAPAPRAPVAAAGATSPAPTSAADWVARFAAAVGAAAPDDEEIDAILGLAGTAAHASERIAAPLSAWLAGRAGVSPADAWEAARILAAALGGDPGREP